MKRIPDCDMPTNDYGEKADIVYSPESTINRMNLGQLYEQFLNCCISKIIRDIKQGNMDYIQGYNHILEFIRDVNPDYADVIEKVVNNNDRKKYDIVKEAMDKEQIILVIPSFLDTLSPEWCLKMCEKYKVDATPVSYNLRNPDGSLYRQVRTIKPVYIGKKYLYILCKIPYARGCAVAYVNQYKIPIRIKERKVKEGYPVGLTPIRIGEDEVRNLVMTIGEDTTARILAMYANNAEGTDKLTEALLTADNPTCIQSVLGSVDELSMGNQTIQVFRHLMNTVGVDTVNIKADPEEVNRLATIEEDFKW